MDSEIVLYIPPAARSATDHQSESTVLRRASTYLIDEPVPDELLGEQGAGVVGRQAARELPVRLVVQTQEQHQLRSGAAGLDVR